MAEARRRSRLRRFFCLWVRVVGVASILVVILAWISTDHFKAFGGSPDEETRARMRSSPPVEPTLPQTTTAWWRALPPTAARCP